MAAQAELTDDGELFSCDMACVLVISHVCCIEL